MKNNQQANKQISQLKFSFARYNNQKYIERKIKWEKNLKFKLKVVGSIGLFLLTVGNIYPLMMWFEHDVNMYKPKVSQYVLNRLN